jgi:DNA topoisomerase IA
MKLPICFSLAVAMIASSAPAAVEQCRFIQVKSDREACYQRQEIARITRQKAQEAHEAVRPKPVESMTPEDDQLAKSLRSICRGC